MNYPNGRFFALVRAAAYGQVGLVETEYSELAMGLTLVGARDICGSNFSTNTRFEGKIRAVGK